MKLQFQIQKWLIGTDLTGHYMNDLFTTSCSIIELLNKGEKNNNGNELAELMKIIPLEKKKNVLKVLKKDGYEYDIQTLCHENSVFSVLINYYEISGINILFAIAIITTLDKQPIFTEIADKYKLKVKKVNKYFTKKEIDYEHYVFKIKRESLIKNVRIRLGKEKQLNDEIIIFFEMTYLNSNSVGTLAIKEGTGLPIKYCNDNRK